MLSRVIWSLSIFLTFHCRTSKPSSNSHHKYQLLVHTLCSGRLVLNVKPDTVPNGLPLMRSTAKPGYFTLKILYTPSGMRGVSVDIVNGRMEHLDLSRMY